MELVDADAFPRWVACMPPSYEADLMKEHVSTAFFLAVRAGWKPVELEQDAAATIRRGVGVGGVVERLRSLAATGRVKRGSNTPSSPHHPKFEPPPPEVFIPVEWARERVQLLRDIEKTRPSPQVAEEMMKLLIGRQKEQGVPG